MSNIRGSGHDEEIRALREKQAELIRRIPLLQQTELVTTSVSQYCEAAKVRYAKCDDFETKRQFMLDHIERIVFWDDRIMVCGSVPVNLETATVRNAAKRQVTKTEGKVEFKITDFSDYPDNGRWRK